MPLHPDWPDILLRIALTLIAGLFIGLDRSEHGKPAGVRTTMLVCLTASLSMILANLLLDTTGKGPGSFAQLDFMRLPLGILTGMGFIGAGTILRRGSLIIGVTTAATLWFVTLLGFCFGAGQYTLGIGSLICALFIMWVVKLLENHIKQIQRATLVVALSPDAPGESDLRFIVTDAGHRIAAWAIRYESHGHRKIRCVVEWSAIHSDTTVPAFVETLRATPGVEKIQWTPAAATR